MNNNDPRKQVVYLRGENNELRFELQAVKTELVRKRAIIEELRALLAKEPVVRFLVNEDHKEN